MSTTHTYSTMEREPPGESGDGRRAVAPDTLPVLARIPDLRAAPAMARPAEVRYDPPHPISAPSPGGDRPAGEFVAARSHVGPRPSTRSNILPANDPFTFPGGSLPDALAPAVRFMLLFVLFTAAGTSVLLLWRSGRPASNNPAGPTAATADPTIAVPTAMEQSVTVLERAVLKPEAATGAAPSAKGPKGAARHGAQSESTEQRISIGAADVEAAIPVSAESPPPGTVSPYPTTNFPLVMLAGTENGPLPRVRTTDDADQKSTTDDAAGIHASTDDGTEGDTARAPAVARLQGEVLAVPVR